MPMALLDVRLLTFSYGTRPVLQDIGFTLARGELLAFLGPNGSGKSTLLKCMNGVLDPPTGAVFLEGRDLRTLLRREVARAIGFVPQHGPATGPSLGGSAGLLVFDVVRMGRRPHEQWGSRERDDEATWGALHRLRLESFAARPFAALSGGERQKVLVARALAQSARVILLDEPTSNLDPRHQRDVLQTIAMLAADDGLAVGIVLHDLDAALQYSQRALLLSAGRIVALGASEEVITPERVRAVYQADAAFAVSGARRHLVFRSGQIE